MKFREQPGGPLIDLPLTSMSEGQVIAAAIMAGHDTTAVQATRRALLTYTSACRRTPRKRVRRREMIEIAMQANSIPDAYRKYATWLRAFLWLVPFPWGSIISAMLWTVDQILSEVSF